MEAAKQRKSVSLLSVSLPVSRATLARQSRAPGHVQPAGKEKVKISSPNFELPRLKESLLAVVIFSC